MSVASDKSFVIDIHDSATWEASVTAGRSHLDQMAKALISIANDKSRSNEQRRKAVFVLAGIESKESLAFLIENVALTLPFGIELTEEDQLKVWHCAYALMQRGSWKTAQAVLASLDEVKSREERMWLGLVLGACLGRKLAGVVVDAEIARTAKSDRKDNLVAIRPFIKPE